jgi:hypothetical protein
MPSPDAVPGVDARAVVRALQRLGLPAGGFDVDDEDVV